MVLVWQVLAVVTGGRMNDARIEFVQDARRRIRWMRLGGRLLNRSAAKL